MKIEKYSKTNYSKLEELLNSYSHGIGIFLGIIGFWLLLKDVLVFEDNIKLISILLFGSTMTFTYVSSTLYHFIKKRDAKRFFLMLDHIAIFLFLGGTFSSWVLIEPLTTFKIVALTTIWSLSISGVFLRLFIFKRTGLILEGLYLLLAIVGSLFGISLYFSLGFNALSLALLGGFFYTVGLIFYYISQLKFNHLLWHVFVMIGNFTHYMLISNYILPY